LRERSRGEMKLQGVVALLVVMTVGLAVPASRAELGAPEDDLRFLQEKVHEYWPHMPHDEAMEFASVLYKMAQEQAFLGLTPAHGTEV
jgi:hypothetical protein